MTGPGSREERIAAFLDGAMDDAELAAFEAELEQDPELAAEVERLAGNDALLQAAFAGPIKEGVDDALLERMGLGVSDRDNVVPIGGDAAPSSRPMAANDNPPFWRRWRVPVGGAIAAGLALALVFNLQGRNGPMSAFGTAMETAPSGQVAMLDDGRTVTPLLTFAAGDGRFCREFSLGKGDAGGTGIACRSDGGWAVEALDAGATELAEGSEIALASGADGEGLDAAYERLEAGDPFDARRESALLASGWKKDRK